MEIEVKLDSAYPEPKVVILTAAMNETVSEIVRKLSEEQPQIISGTRDGLVEVLEPQEIIRVYADSGKTIAATTKGEYTLRLRLYEAEERLDGRQFVRISNSEIINLKKAACFDMSITGTICVKLSDGTVTYVSRRYVAGIKRLLGV